MGNLIKAEFRKILTTKLWWALLIPAVLLAFGYAFVLGKAITGIGDFIKHDGNLHRAGVNVDNISIGVFALSRSINITSVFPMLFGALGLSTELHRRTITTTFLTASSRGAVLAAKAVTYVAWGVIYGIVISGMVAVGAAAATGGNYLPDASGFLLILLAGVLECLLWTLLGLGFGALLGSPVGSVLILALYAVAIEPVLDLALHNTVAGILPNGAADGLTGSTAGQILINQLQGYAHSTLAQVMGPDDWNRFLFSIRAAAGGIGALDWWASGLVFLGWAALLFGIGLWRNHTRDIT
jgi:ABC-2 type transport system permease protein